MRLRKDGLRVTRPRDELKYCVHHAHGDNDAADDYGDDVLVASDAQGTQKYERCRGYAHAAMVRVL